MSRRTLWHVVMWLIGLALIAWQGWWWPGLVVMVLASIVLEVVASWRRPKTTQIGDITIGGSVNIKGNVVGRDQYVVNDPAITPPVSSSENRAKRGGIHLSGNVSIGGDVVGRDSVVVRRSRAQYPTKCSNCGGPITTANSKLTTRNTVQCPHCGTELPIGSTQA